MFGRAWATMLGWCAMASNRESDHVIPDGCRDGCDHETLPADGPPVEDRLEQPAPRCPECRHAPHDDGPCFNLASDNDCDCTYGSDYSTGAQNREYRNPHLNELAALKSNWDSYKADAITPSALAAADTVTFVPCNDGGIQIEIHVGSGQQVEVFIEPCGCISGVYLKGVEVEDSDPL